MEPVTVTLTVVGWLMNPLISKVLAEWMEKWAKRNNLGNEFTTLKNQLLQLDTLLGRAHYVRTDNDSLKELVQNLQQLAYRAENLLDELDYYRLEDEIKHRASSSRFRRACYSISSPLKSIYFRSERDVPVSLPGRQDVLASRPKTFPSRDNLSQRMKELNVQLQTSVQTTSQVIPNTPEISQAEGTNLRQPTSSFLIDPRVFGRKQECDKLMNLLVTNEEFVRSADKIPVLAIVGSVGVGKTTLAQRVFEDPEVLRYFQVRSWICVSNGFDIERLIHEMLGSACGNGYNKLSNLDALQKKLKHKLFSKRFLFVFDDMWEDKKKSQWDSMIAPLKDMVKGSIILVTTRHQSVAKMVDARDNICLRGLDDASFLSFFSTLIFNDSNYGGNQRLREMGQQFANKLMGNPLAAKTVTNLLKGHELDERYWMNVRDKEEWKHKSGPDDIIPALRLSYDHMPFHLQRCFSYCAMLPEDHTFTCEELVYLWMAQGFLNVRSEDETMEDIGNAYFNDLLNHGFFQTKQSANGGSVCYTFHYLLHCFAQMVSLKECLSINGTKPRQIPPTIRHLSIFKCRETGEEAIVRDLACLEGDNLSTIINGDELPSGIFQSISNLLKETKYLRAVRLTLHSQVQPHNIKFQNFVSLRYLRLIMSNSNACMTLPREICRLYHLLVFEIEGEWSPDELPNNFSDLVSLRHFIVAETKLHSKIRGVGKLQSLQELNNFDVQQDKSFEIEQLGPLKEIGGSLHIWNLGNVKSKEEASKARLAEKEKLDALYLQWNHGTEEENESALEGLQPNTYLKSLDIEGYGGVGSPTWLEPSLIFFESLTLLNCKAWELRPPIWQSCKHLKLSELSLREIGPQCYGTSQNMKFQSLEELEIRDMPNLEKWVLSDQLQLFLHLKKLTIEGCSKLVDLPLSGCATSEVLECFPSLESLIIKDCPLILQLPPLPYSSLLSFISIERTRFIKVMHFKKGQELSLILDQSSSLQVGEPLAFHELSSLCILKISDFSSLESLDLHSFVVLQELFITGCQSLTSLTIGEHLVCLATLDIQQCQSLTSLTFGEHLVSLRRLIIISCRTLNSIKGLKSWVYLKELNYRECPGFIAAWDSASKEIQRTEPDFSLSLEIIESNSLDLLTLPICNQLTSLRYFSFEVSSITEEHEVSMQLLTSIDLIDIEGCKNLQSFPFHLFPSLKSLMISFPHIESLPINNHTEITEECEKLRNIEEVEIFNYSSIQIKFGIKLRGNDMPAAGHTQALLQCQGSEDMQALINMSWSYANFAAMPRAGEDT